MRSALDTSCGGAVTDSKERSLVRIIGPWRASALRPIYTAPSLVAAIGHHHRQFRAVKVRLAHQRLPGAVLLGLARRAGVIA